jgi:hypothetical protein
MILHSPWALYICERTPLGMVITDKGREVVAELEASRAEIPAA